MSDNSLINKPLASSVLIHSQASSEHATGLQALIVKDIEAYDATLCTESYRKLGLVCPPMRDPTVQWLKQVQPNNSGFVYLQTVDKAMPFLPFDKTMSPNRLILTTKAYIKLLGMFAAPRQQESEWNRMEKKVKVNMAVMRTNTKPVVVGPFLSFVSHGSSIFYHTIEKYTDWNLMLVVYGESQWDPDTPLKLTLKYTQNTKNADAGYTGSHIQIYPELLVHIVTEELVNHLKKNYITNGYFTTPPVLVPSNAVIDILAIATKEANIKPKPKEPKVKKVNQTLKDCGLGDLSDSSSSDEDKNLDTYSLPVLTSKNKLPSKGKPYDRPVKK